MAGLGAGGLSRGRIWGSRSHRQAGRGQGAAGLGGGGLSRGWTWGSRSHRQAGSGQGQQV